MSFRTERSEVRNLKLPVRQLILSYMKSITLLILTAFLSGILNAQELAVAKLTSEYKTNPVGIDCLQPRFSWKITGSGSNILQTAYSIRVASDQKFSSG